jgi:putative flippase GtrA
MSSKAGRLHRLVRFGAVGVAGFLVDGGLLQLLVASGLAGPIVARLVSFPSAVLVTWTLNRRVTFGDRGAPLRSLLRYVLVSAVGTTLNFVVYSALVLGASAMAARPLIPFAIASVLAMTVNYLGASQFAFGGKPND